MLTLALGRVVRGWREAEGWSRNRLAQAAGLSLRFLAEIESGRANLSLARLDALAGAMGMTPANLLWAGQAEADGIGGDDQSSRPREPSRASLLARLGTQLGNAPVHHLQSATEWLAGLQEDPELPPVIALLGLRGAGKSTLGPLLADALEVPFHESDDLIAERSGLRPAELFELHGEAYYREAERKALASLIASGAPAVVAVSGGIVTDSEGFALLRNGCTLVWLHAPPELHMGRVEAQGDSRPMRNRPNAMAELKALLNKRGPQYRQARIAMDTSKGAPRECAARLCEQLAAAGYPAPRRLPTE